VDLDGVVGGGREWYEVVEGGNVMMLLGMGVVGLGLLCGVYILFLCYLGIAG
jgi:uncharacterized membrane protein